jgi:hypothetical protein
MNRDVNRLKVILTFGQLLRDNSRDVFEKLQYRNQDLSSGGAKTRFFTHSEKVLL